MSQSRLDKRRTCNMIVKKSPSSNNKKMRKPLKCKKNVIHASESKKKSSKKCKFQEKNMYSKKNEKSSGSPKRTLRSSPRLYSLSKPENNSKYEKSSPTFKMLDSIEIDDLSSFKQFNRKTSSRQKQEFQPTRLSIASENRTLCKNKRQSVYKKSNLIDDFCNNPKSKMDFKMATPRSSELPADSLKLRNSIVLRSTQKNKEASNDMVLSNRSEVKENGMSSTTPKNIKEIQSLSSESEKASVQKNKKINSVSVYIEKEQIDNNHAVPKAAKLFTDIGSSRNSITLRGRRSSEKRMEKSEKRDSVLSSFRELGTEKNRETPIALKKLTSTPRSSMMLRTRHSSENPSRNRVSSRKRHSEKASNNFLSDETPHITTREKIKKYPLISKEQKKEKIKNVEHPNKKASSSQQETEMLAVRPKRGNSTSDPSLKSKDLQTPKRLLSKSPKNTASSPRKSLRLLSEKKSEETSSGDVRVKKCHVFVTNKNKQRQTKKSAVSPKKQKAELKGKIRGRKRLPPSPLKTITPIVKRRKLSVQFKKQARPRSYSAIIPVDDLALTPAFARKTQSDGYKLPGRTSLKRKRFVMDEIKKADDGYEDDIYESKTFEHFKYMFPDSSDSSEMSCPIKTPKITSLLTPGIHCKTPAYKDCFSPTEYARNRKIAEEYIYRTRKKKRTSQVETPEVPEKKKLEFNKVVEKACAAQKEVEKLTADSSDDEDSYFTEDI